MGVCRVELRFQTWCMVLCSNIFIESGAVDRLFQTLLCFGDLIHYGRFTASYLIIVNRILTVWYSVGLHCFIHLCMVILSG